MGARRLRPLSLLLAFALSACTGDVPAGPRLVEDIVPSSIVVDRLDPARTYEYRFTTVQPESLLAVLLAAGVPVEEAWLPLDNQCSDPRGPVFTVALETPDVRILGYDFDPGTGRLACATLVRRYRVVR